MKKWTLTLTNENSEVLDIWTSDDISDRIVFVDLAGSDIAEVTAAKINDHLAETFEEMAIAEGLVP